MRLKKVLPEERKSRGRTRNSASFPAASQGNLPETYRATLKELKQRIQQERLRITLSANSAMTLLYWDIGKTILSRQEAEGWGAKTIDRLSNDLQKSFPDMKGFSPRNLKYMRAFAAAWGDKTIVQRVIAQIPWRSNITLLDKLQTNEDRLWYANKTIEYGWSQTILSFQIEADVKNRQGKTVNNFQATMPPLESAQRRRNRSGT